MSQVLERSSWEGRATYLRAICLSLQQSRRDFPLDERYLVAFLGFLYTCLAVKSGPQIGAVAVPSYVSGIRATHDALSLECLPTFHLFV